MCKGIRYVFAAPLLLSVTACHDDFAVDPERGDAMELRAEINQQYTTRASDGGFANGDQIGVFIVNYVDEQSQSLEATGNHADNVCFTYDEATGKWTGSYQLYWKDKKTPIDAYGYYPFDAELESTAAYPFCVQQNQRDQMKTGRKLSGYEQSDFLWAKKEGVVPTSGAVTLRHHHLMAGIKVSLKEGFGFDDGEWSDIQKAILVENTVLESTINLQTGTVTPMGSATGVITPLPVAGEAGGEVSYRAVVVPQTVAAGASLFSFTIDNKSYHFTRDEALTYYSGKLHQFTFDVQKSLETGDYQFTLISESVTPWDNDPLSHDGSAREYITVNVEEGEYLGDLVTRMGIDPKEIINLKLTGTIVGNGSFDYITKQMPQLESLHLKDVRTKEVYLRHWESGWGEVPYGLPIVADDWLPGLELEFLQHIVWPDSVKGLMGIESRCLRGSLIFPEGLKVIEGHYSGALTGELYIPSTVEYIGDGAFSGSSLSGELVLPERMKYLGSSAFGRCQFLTGRIHIPYGLTEVNPAWWGTAVTGVAVIPQGVKRINGIGCIVSDIVIPEGVEEINGPIGLGDMPAFRGFYYDKLGDFLTNDIKLPSTVRRISSYGFASGMMKHVSLPEGLEFIEDRAFEGSNLQDTLVLPSSVVQIREAAFESCTKLEAVVLPEHLEEIREWAFSNCRSLYYVYSKNPVPPVLNGSAFNGVEKNECALVVPEGSVDAYRNAPGWKEFKRISAYQNFVCRPMQAKLLNKSNTRIMVLNSDGNWQVTHCPDWIHPSATSGYKKTELTIKIDEMAHGLADRNDSIVFTLTDKTDENGQPITCYYKVQQFDYEYDEDSQALLQKATRGQRGGINIVFVGDGYDAEDIARGRFLEDMKEGAEYFFAVEPYKTYKEYFNVYADMAMSYESGVCSSVDIWRQTKFGTTYGSGENGRLGISANDVFSYVLNDVSESAITAANVDQSLIICVPNDDAYEGVTTLYSSGAAVAFAPHSRYSYPNDYRGLIQHEAGGHGFGKLGDEYIYHRDNILTCPCVCCGHADHVAVSKAIGWYRNLSLEGRYKMVDWSHLIFDPRYGDIVDIYEGGYMHGRGIYRSEVNSCMNNNVPYYSTISRQAIVERIMQYSGEPFDFETFVAQDSREMGEKFLTRTGTTTPAAAMQGQAPVIIKGSPLDYIKKGGKR